MKDENIALEVTKKEYGHLLMGLSIAGHAQAEYANQLSDPEFRDARGEKPTEESIQEMAQVAKGILDLTQRLMKDYGMPNGEKALVKEG